MLPGFAFAVFSAQVPLQRGHSASGPFRQHHQRGTFRLVVVAAIDAVLEKILAFVERGTGDVEKVCEVGVRSPPESLGDIPRRRRCRVPNLVDEPESRLTSPAS